jgi:hypothetical protein
MKVLITGGTNGMGKGVAKTLAGADNQFHEIIILGRDKKLGEIVVNELENTTSNKKVSFVLCDLTKLSDVKRAIQEIHDTHDYLDGIFINAGLGYAAKRIETEDGMDPHFQVNYLSQFMLTLILLELLEKSEHGGRIVFNVTKTKKDIILWDDLQMRNNWSFEVGVHQAMVAKRMFLAKLHALHREQKDSKLSFIGFQISKTVWSNQINIIPAFMKIMATLMKLFGTFISIEKCGEIISPLFTEDQVKSLKRSGKFITWKKDRFVEIIEDQDVLNRELQDKLWDVSLELCADKKTYQIAKDLKSI